MRLDIASVHFAKTGGTSLGHALQEHYGDALFRDYSHDPCNPNHYPNEPPVLAENIRAVHGHFRADRYLMLRPKLLVTFLRDPIGKLFSVYFFWKGLQPHGNSEHDRFLKENPTIIDYARQTAGIAPKAYFGGIDMRLFDFIGFQETLSYDLSILSIMTRIKLKPVFLNSTPTSEERIRFEGDPEIRQQLQKILAEDIDFYERAKAIRYPRLYASKSLAGFRAA